jgi:hypothetical protein
MTLPTSGPLSLTDIQTEFGGSNPIGLNEYYAGGGLVPSGTTGTNGAVPSSGQIAISNFYGTAAYYGLTKSLRLRKSASANLTRTPGSNGNRQVFTISFWTKLGSFATGSDSFFWSSGDAAPGIAPINLGWKTFDGTYYFFAGFDGGNSIATTAVYRDPSAWYHIVLAIDTTQATASNRAKFYVNGSQVTDLRTASYPTQNLNFEVGSGNKAFFGALNISNSPNRFFDGYLAEINFIGGQQLTPSSFGAYNSTLGGMWQPLKYTGSYGTNGYYLPFTDTTSTTTLVADSSGNGNNFTPSNISLTAGVTYDSMTDVPTLTSTTAANYCVMNPLRTNNGTLTNGNLTASSASASYKGFSSTMAMRTGKWYWEVTCTSIGFVTSIGITNSSSVSGLATGMWSYHYDGTKYIGGSNSAYGASYASGDVLGFAFDADAGSLTCYKNNVSQGVLVSGLPSVDYFAYATLYDTWNIAYNFGQRPFAYTPPTNFLALNAFNI